MVVCVPANVWDIEHQWLDDADVFFGNATTTTSTTTSATLTVTNHRHDASTISEFSTSTILTKSIPQHFCEFEIEPRTSYYWDSNCRVDGTDHLGCKADGINQECRFCGMAPYGPCPVCEFDDPPSTQYVWDNACKPGEYTRGCFADGVHFECRFCGLEGLDDCPTPATDTSTTSSSTMTSRSAINLDFLDSGNSQPEPKQDIAEESDIVSSSVRGTWGIAYCFFLMWAIVLVSR